MKSFSKCVVALMALVLLAGTTKAADAIVGGEVKSIKADKKEFVIHSDATNKDVTVHLAPDVVVNRGGTEGTSDLKVGDTVNVCHDNGKLKWTAHYILVRTGDTKDCVLRHGTVKSYDPEAKRLVFTDSNGNKDEVFTASAAKVRLNKEDAKIGSLRIGDDATIIVETKGGKETLKSVMVRRK